MAASYNLLKDLDVAADHQAWHIKVRVIKSWSIQITEDRYRKPMLEMVVMDELLVTHIEQHPTTEYIVVIQFAKFNLFKGTMGISNTNYNSVLYINADFDEVKAFRERFCVHLRVFDDTDIAYFIVYDKECTRFLGNSASDLRAVQLTRGCTNDDMLYEINSFKSKKFLFKISVMLEDMNAFQPCKIIVLRLTEDRRLLFAFASKHKIYDKNLLLENSELLSFQTESTDTAKETSTQSCEIISLNGDKSFVTPQKPLIAGGWSRRLSEVFPDVENSSSKSRKTN
ncbi:hypothetical protein AHAS_Ahas20G0259600 [Arachis hypogaea]